MKIVETYGDKKECISYLKYNNYGKVFRVWNNKYLCTKKGYSLRDVKIIL